METHASYLSQKLVELNKFESSLPSLVGAEGWHQVGTQITQTFATLRSTDDLLEQSRLELQLFALLSDYPTAFWPLTSVYMRFSADVRAPYSSQKLIELNKLESTLPSLVGAEGWDRVGTQVMQTLATLRSTDDLREESRLKTQLFSLLDDYPAAYRRVTFVYRSIAAGDDGFYIYTRLLIKPVLLSFAVQEHVNHKDVEQTITQLCESIFATSYEKINLIQLSYAGLKGATITNVGYLEIDFYHIITIVSSAIMTVDGVLHNPWLLPFGLLVTLAQLYDIATEEIDKQDATVLWGLMLAASRPNNYVDEHHVVESTNRQRQRFELHALSEEEVHSSLSMLKRLRIAIYDEETKLWRFVEGIKIAGEY